MQRISAHPCLQWQALRRVRLFVTPGTAAHQASLSITNSRSLLKSRSIESVMPSSHPILCRPLLLLPPIFPRSLVRMVNSLSDGSGSSLSHTARCGLTHLAAAVCEGPLTSVLNQQDTISFSEKRERKTQGWSIILSLGETHDETGFKRQAVSEGVS